jgi:hypothetical protein
LIRAIRKIRIQKALFFENIPLDEIAFRQLIVNAALESDQGRRKE